MAETQHEKRTPLVLVCDDDADARNLISSTISVLGYETLEAVDGLDAKEKCQARLPDLIVLDIMMPRMTGIEFLSWFREEIQEPFVPVLLLTALDQIDNRVEGFAKGADDYLTKPFNWRELQVRVNALLRIRELTERLRERSVELATSNAKLIEIQRELVEKEKQLTASEMAGAAAHNLGQPVQTMLLNLFLLESYFASAEGSDPAERKKAEDAVRSMQQQCSTLKSILSKLQTARPNATTPYIGAIKIVDIE